MAEILTGPCRTDPHVLRARGPSLGQASTNVKRCNHITEQMVLNVAEGKKLRAEDQEVAETDRYLEVTPLPPGSAGSISTAEMTPMSHL